MTSSLDTDLAEYWPLDEASGTRAGNVASLTLTDNNTVMAQAGKLAANSAMFVAANTESLSRATSATITCGDIDFTVAVWFYLSVTGWQSGAVSTLFYKEAAAGQRDYWGYVSSGTPVFAKENASSVFKAAIWNKRVINSGWHLFVGWHDAAADLLWIQIDNGTAVSGAMAAAGQSASSPGTLLLGSSGHAGQYLDGALAGMTLWKRVLTDDERSMVYNEGNGLVYPFTPTLLWGEVVPGMARFPKNFMIPRVST